MNNRRNAYTEVNVVLQQLEEEEYNKIPVEVVEAIRENMNEEYKFKLDDELELKEQKLLPETKAILFNLFRDYLATPEQRKKIIKMQNDERQKNELKKQQKYSADIFKNRSKVSTYEEKQINNEEKIFHKIIDKVKNKFTKK